MLRDCLKIRSFSFTGPFLHVRPHGGAAAEQGRDPRHVRGQRQGGDPDHLHQLPAVEERRGHHAGVRQSRLKQFID